METTARRLYRLVEPIHRLTPAELDQLAADLRPLAAALDAAGRQ
jgi:hypothetical protein